MNPWLQLATTQMPDGGGELRLMRRAAEFSIMLGTTELMNSRLSGSEEALARLSCAAISGRARPHILIGGLGMGFTLRAALAELPPEAKITVAELVPAVVDWAKGEMAPIFGTCLEDPRVSMALGDVGPLIRRHAQHFDAILLDVDNGPDGLTRKANDAIYGLKGLAAARAALTPGGVLSVWSSAPDADFTKRLARSGFGVEEVKVRANTKRGARHIIWMATRA